MSSDNNDTPVLALPAPGDNAPSPAQGELWSQGVKMDHLGPIIVNPDGTMSRISNWDALSEGEKAVALRRIAQRNKARIDDLLAEEKAKEEAAANKNKAAGDVE